MNPDNFFRVNQNIRAGVGGENPGRPVRQKVEVLRRVLFWKLGLRLAIAKALESYEQQLPGKQLAHRLPLAIGQTNPVRTAHDRRDFIVAVDEKFRSTDFPW